MLSCYLLSTISIREYLRLYGLSFICEAVFITVEKAASIGAYGLRGTAGGISGLISIQGLKTIPLIFITITIKMRITIIIWKLWVIFSYGQ